ncbi:MAG TPA: cell division protein ZipA C-terminal FtsZ-binding domain-containing protein [Gallionella sp.]
MSELQLALLTIGIGMIAVLYAYGWWQQRQYRRRFGEAFGSDRADALYQGLDAGLAQAPVAGAGGEMAATLLDESCTLLEDRTDFIIELHLGEASLPSVLNGLWQRKFDFGKPVYICGQPLGGGKWERVIADSPALYERFRISLQLVDRGGAISAAKLADFRDLVTSIARQIKADATVPDIDETQRRAARLDAFCADVDQMVGINLVPPGARLLLGSKIAHAGALLGMTLESDGAFHLLDAQGHSLFSLSNLDTQPFQHHLLETTGTMGITLLLDVPRVDSPAVQFDRLMHIAHGLAKSLQAELVDDHHIPLSESGLDRIRERIAAVEAQMRDQGFAPGSAQARRLFS